MEQMTSIVWNPEQITVFHPETPGSGAFYPRMLVLKNGTWLVAYDTNEGGGATRCQVSRSTDAGKTWAVLSVASTGNGDAANAQMLETQDGILLAYRLVEGDKKSLKLTLSKDGGATWQERGIIDDADMTDFRGVWEPHLGFLPDGKLAVMYASEKTQPEWPQVIEMKVSADLGLSWGQSIRVSECATSRDGMPVWTVTKDGHVLVVLEAQDDPQGIKPFLIRGKLSKDGYDWSGERFLVYSPEQAISRAAAPYVACLKNGALVVSAQVDYNPTGYDMHAVLSTDNGKTWKKTNAPFETEGDDMWNGMCALPDGGLAALTCTNASGNTEIRIRLGQPE